MQGFDGFTLPIQHALNLHQATGIVGNHILRAGFGNGGAFDLAHGRGNHWKLDGERAAKTAAGFRLAHLYQFQSPDMLQQLAWRFFQAQFPQAMAAVMKCRPARKPGAHVEDTQLTDEKVGKFKDFRRQRPCLSFSRVMAEQLGIKNLDHRATRPGGDDHGFGVPEKGHLPFRHRSRFLPVTGIECGLTATRLRFGIIHAMPQSFQHLDDAHPDLRIKLVHKTGDEQGDFHALNRVGY